MLVTNGDLHILDVLLRHICHYVVLKSGRWMSLSLRSRGCCTVVWQRLQHTEWLSVFVFVSITSTVLGLRGSHSICACFRLLLALSVLPHGTSH
eukprot:jgi/Phyca11/114505/e_gw1.26.506.1